MLQVTPESFCETKGAGTFLEHKYRSARIDEDGCLIIVLTKGIAAAWKNDLYYLHVLQCVLDDTKDIGITVDYSKDPSAGFLDLMKNANTCGYEISDDFTKIIASPGDNVIYFLFMPLACLIMQAFEGKMCTDYIVEYIELDENGAVEKHIVNTGWGPSEDPVYW